MSSGRNRCRSRHYSQQGSPKAKLDSKAAFEGAKQLYDEAKATSFTLTSAEKQEKLEQALFIYYPSSSQKIKDDKYLQPRYALKMQILLALNKKEACRKEYSELKEYESRKKIRLDTQTKDAMRSILTELDKDEVIAQQKNQTPLAPKLSDCKKAAKSNEPVKQMSSQDNKKAVPRGNLQATVFNKVPAASVPNAVPTTKYARVSLTMFAECKELPALVMTEADKQFESAQRNYEIALEMNPGLARDSFFNESLNLLKEVKQEMRYKEKASVLMAIIYFKLNQLTLCKEEIEAIKKLKELELDTKEKLERLEASLKGAAKEVRVHKKCDALEVKEFDSLVNVQLENLTKNSLERLKASLEEANKKVSVWRDCGVLEVKEDGSSVDAQLEDLTKRSLEQLVSDCSDEQKTHGSPQKFLTVPGNYKIQKPSWDVDHTSHTLFSSVDVWRASLLDGLNKEAAQSFEVGRAFRKIRSR